MDCSVIVRSSFGTEVALHDSAQHQAALFGSAQQKKVALFESAHGTRKPQSLEDAQSKSRTLLKMRN
jgi:hypothetical protein